MPETLGARLRQRREERGIALVTIAKQTKIKESLLDGLEKDDLSQWPSKLYRRAFVRAYAGAIGLDPEVIVQEFLQAHPDPPEIDVIAAMASTLDRADGLARRSIGFRKVMGSAYESLSRLNRSAVVADRPMKPPDPNGTRVLTPNSPVVIAVAPPGPPPMEETPQDRAMEADSVPAAPVSTPAPEPAPAPAPAPDPELDLSALAILCTELGRVEQVGDVPLLLEESARLLDAKGLIVWLWDASAGELRPALVHGYSDRVVSQLPMVKREANNPTAAAFRSAEACASGDGPHACGALVVPLLTSAGCAGVLAIELQRGREATKPVVALATILASHLAQMPGRVLPVEFVPRPRLAAGGLSVSV